MCESHARIASVRDPLGVFAWCGAGPRADVPRGPYWCGALGEGPARPPLRPALEAWDAHPDDKNVSIFRSS